MNCLTYPSGKYIGYFCGDLWLYRHLRPRATGRCPTLVFGDRVKTPPSIVSGSITKVGSVAVGVVRLSASGVWNSNVQLAENPLVEFYDFGQIAFDRGS